MATPYTILEVANCHGGDLDYLYSLIDEMKEFRHGFGVKFQPFKYDEIATSDYEWYPVYQKLFFSEIEWKQIIVKASETKDIWLDLFDKYSIKILKENLNKIHGIKLQVSVLNNVHLLTLLQSIDLSNLKVIINISGLELDEIKRQINFLSSILNPNELLIEVGFQSYPTSVEDSGIGKLIFLKKNLDKKIVFADHVDGKSEDAVWFPVIAAFAGADVVEKHICHSIFETKYDAYSSINLEKIRQLTKLLGT